MIDWKMDSRGVSHAVIGLTSACGVVIEQQGASGDQACEDCINIIFSALETVPGFKP